MTQKEKISRNLGLTFDFLRQVAKDPAILDKVPDGSTLEFVEKDFARIEKARKRKPRSKTKYLRVKSRLEVI